MAYQHTYLKSSITIRSVVSIHYFEYMSDFHFPGECHDFWELVCVDKGEIQAAAGDKMVTLKRGSILFHQPGEFHSVIANGRVSPSLVVISFDCRSRAMNQFAGQILTVRETEASLLSRIIIEARNAFQGRLNDPYQEELNRRMLPQAFGAEQLIKNYLEELLICLYRRYWPLIPGAGSIPRDGSSLSLPSVPDTGLGQISLNSVEAKKELCIRIQRYLEAHLQESLTLQQICRDNLIGSSQLSRLFYSFHHCGVIDYFIRLKIDAAKQMIRNDHMNFSQIADRLGYSSIHYFSRQFKKQTGMTPTEYSESIRCLAEKNAAGWNYREP